ncbi:MAG: phosphoribosyl-AMP cyclohydrolase [Sneathiella sp.]|nr:phosphoribosyl-AMP cyclohydrolase [Sneathiella sp.]
MWVISPMNEKLASLIKFNEAGLVPAIAQQHDTGEVLMMAWMNSDAIAETLETGQVCYWSRSRQSLWRKGESSGHIQTLVDFRLDCDGDTILLLVEQKGVACHTGRHNCFFYSAKDADVKIISEVEISPEEMYNKE